MIEVKNSVQRLKENFFSIYKHAKKDLYDGNYGPLFSVYHESDEYDVFRIINERLDKTFLLVKDLGLKNIYSVVNAKNCHPNEDFRNLGFGTGDMADLYGVVNHYGMQSAENYEKFIIDRNIYLGKRFFTSPKERTITLLHELSHLVEGDYSEEENYVINFLDPMVDPYILTRDEYTEDRGDAQNIYDSYAWERFLLLYLEKI